MSFQISSDHNLFSSQNYLDASNSQQALLKDTMTTECRRKLQN